MRQAMVTRLAITAVVLLTKWSSGNAGEKMDVSSFAPEVIRKGLRTSRNDFNSDTEEKAFVAIRHLHRQMDDDHSGNIDLSESDEFIREELNNDNDREHRQRNFHQNDFQISVHELWVSFKKSAIYNWTVDDVATWLTHHVDLPEYANIFREKGITGLHLPQLAANQDHYFTKTMGRRFPADIKRKIILKATDAVIFGPPTNDDYNTFKDVVLFLTIVVAPVLAWLADAKAKETKRNIRAMIAKMESLSKTEADLKELQEQLKEEEQLNVELELSREEEAKAAASLKEEIKRVEDEADKLKAQRLNCEEKAKRLRLAEEELERVGTALRHAEEELSVYDAETNAAYQYQRDIPEDLKLLLRETFRYEADAYSWQKNAAETRLSEAKDFCGKVRKKRGSVFNVITSSTADADGLMDSVDARIADARHSLLDLGSNLRERRQRWQRIEILCGVSLRSKASSSSSSSKATSPVNYGASFDDVVDEGRESSPGVLARSSGSFSSYFNLSSTTSSGKRRSVDAFDSSNLGSVAAAAAATSRRSVAASDSFDSSSSRLSESASVSFHLHASESSSSHCDLSSVDAFVASAASRRSSEASFQRSSTMPRGLSRLDNIDKHLRASQTFLRTNSEASLAAAGGRGGGGGAAAATNRPEMLTRSDQEGNNSAVKQKSNTTSKRPENFSKPFSDDTERRRDGNGGGGGGESLLDAGSNENSPKSSSSNLPSLQEPTKKFTAKKLLSKILSRDKINEAGREKSPKMKRST